MAHDARRAPSKSDVPADTLTEVTETTENTGSTASAKALRDSLTDKLIKQGNIRSQPVEAVFRTVPRHLFAPEATPEKAYDAESVVATKKNEHGITISSVSAPTIQATMLEQAEIKPVCASRRSAPAASTRRWRPNSSARTAR